LKSLKYVPELFYNIWWFDKVTKETSSA